METEKEQTKIVLPETIPQPPEIVPPIIETPELEGMKFWNKERLQTPKAVLFATDEYREEMDVFGNFVQERCVQKKEVSINIKKLYKAYSE